MSAAAERSVIGGCLLDNDAYWRAAAVLQAEDFGSTALREIWQAISVAAGNGEAFDAVSLAESFGLPMDDLIDLAQETPSAANVETYARIVRDRAMVRAANVEIEAARKRLLEGDRDAIPELQSRLEALHRTDRPSTSFGDALRAGLSDIEAAQERAQAGGGVIGAPTGIGLLDWRLGGLSGGKLIILAARPSLGKTALAMQISQSSAEAGFPVGVMSLEMGAGEIAVRAFAHQYQVNNTLLAAGDRDTVSQFTGRLAGDDRKRERVKSLPIYIDEDTFSLPGIVARISEWKRKHGIRLVVIDHLQLIELAAGFNRNDGLGEVTRQLKIIAKRLDIPVLLLCQLNRNVERESRKPRLSDLRDSGNIEQDADIVMLLHGGLEPDHRGMRQVEIGFMKFRGGLVGWAGELMFNGPTQTFRPMEYRYETRTGT